MLQSGATQTSGLMATYSRVLRQIELWEDKHLKDTSLAVHRAAVREAQQQADGNENPGERPDIKRPRYTPPGEFHIGFSSGSIDGVIGRMSEAQNLSRAAAFMAEGGVFMQWLAEQSGGHQGLITQLTDRIVWDKVTVKDAGSDGCLLLFFTVAVRLLKLLAYESAPRIAPRFLLMLPTLESAGPCIRRSSSGPLENVPASCGPRSCVRPVCASRGRPFMVGWPTISGPCTACTHLRTRWRPSWRT